MAHMGRRPSWHRGACLVQVILVPTQATCTGDFWEAALALAQEGLVRLSSMESSWSHYSVNWLPFADQVLQNPHQSIQECPEGSVATLAHSLLAMDQVDQQTTRQSIKMMHHALEVPTAVEESGWRDYGLMTASSLLHFMYLKWVNIPQDNDRPKVTEDLSLDLEMLRPHHEFLFRNFVGDFVTKGVYELSITENSVYFSEAFAFVSFCHLYQVDFIAESGVYKGVSTEIWSLFAKEVAAIDLAISVEAESRLRPRRNVKLYAGDGQALLPALLSERPERHAAVFVDGPKGELAIHLALSLCERPEVLREKLQGPGRTDGF
ncbi:unnamed protein product [Durusdinium trenchii]|uniref:Queuosine salvage protein n=1 Tax=Durusdinium trenchii TaxID=1381693 RepID=A0ABP0I305_9DINO